MKRIASLTVLILILLTVHAESQIRGYRNAPRTRSWRIGLEAGVGVIGSDLTRESNNYHFRPLTNLEVAFVPSKNFAAGIFGGGGWLRSSSMGSESNTSFFHAGLFLELRTPMFRGSLFPVLQLRGGVVSMSPELRTGLVTMGPGASTHYSYSGAVGLEVISWRRLGIRALVGVTYTTTDEWDLLVRGNDNDGYSFALLSMHYYIIPRR